MYKIQYLVNQVNKEGSNNIINFINVYINLILVTINVIECNCIMYIVYINTLYHKEIIKITMIIFYFKLNLTL